MIVHKFEITTWTSSFRYPNIISGFQPTLEVPPLSTVLGLLNSASGKYDNYQNFEIGYYFDFQAKSVDIETLYQVNKISPNNYAPSLKATSNIIKREFLYDCRLLLYIKDDRIKEHLLHPVYPMLLGRSSDLANIKYYGDINLLRINKSSKIKGQIIPLFGNYLPGVIQPLPQYFTNSNIRKNLGTQPYSIISYKSADCKSNITTYRDQISDNDIDIYFHKIDLGNE